MAKKQASTTPSGTFDFAKMDAALSKIPGFELGSIIANNTFSEIDEYIPTGNYLLNACISGSLFGGIPNSRSLGLNGDPECVTGDTLITVRSVINGEVSLESKTIEIFEVVCLLENGQKFEIDTPDGWQLIGGSTRKGEKNCWTITTQTKSLSGSDIHLVEAISGWVSMLDLKVGDEIITKDGIETILSKTAIGNEEVYDIEVLHENHRYWSNGISSHNTGKTFFCLNFAREAQKLGYHIIYCETEGAVDRNTVAKIGIDVNNLRYQPIKTVNQFRRFTVQVIEMVHEARKAGQNPKIALFLDSLGMLTTEKEINDAMEGKDAMDMGIKAKQMRAMFRLITLDLAANKIPLIVTNHTTTANIGSYTGPTKEAAGGDGPTFSLSTSLMLSKKFDVDDKDKSKKTGIIVNVRPKKTRSTIPTQVTVHVGFVGGMNPFVGLEEYVTWDACGIQKGKIYTEKEYAKEGVSGGITFDWDDVDKTTGEILKTEKLVFVPKETGRWCVKHFGTSLTSASKLYNKEVFTESVLKSLDEKVIQSRFKLPEYVEDEMAEYDEEVEIED